MLPFTVLVRGALLAHAQLGLPAWPSVLIGLVAGGLALAGIATALWRRWRGFGSRSRRQRRRRLLAFVLVPTLFAFGIYSLGWLAHANAKTDQVAARWHELHPVLRLALGPVRLADPSLVVTEISRRPEDYARMGLRRAVRSPHYRQPDGWVHAIDVRTQGRSTMRNLLVQGWYASMGFQTLRHAGTADHLHVAMP